MIENKQVEKREGVLPKNTLVAYAIASNLIKLLAYYILGNTLEYYPHFQTPLSSLRSVKEAVYSHASNGHYYSD